MVLIVFKLYFIRLLFNQNISISFWKFFVSGWMEIFITGTRLMSIWVLAYHLYHYAQREINTAKENARLSVIAKEIQLNNLSSQLNPHFFFNSLSNIKFLVIENPVSARRAIDLLSDLLRNSLYGKDDKLVTVIAEVNFVKDYLELEKLRFENRLQVNIVIDEELAKIFIPPFCIQALVENAIKHGIEKRKEGGLIEVKTEKKKGLIKISVQNPGKLDKGKQPGLGLENLAERLGLQYNGKARFEIEELPGEKILATILISTM
jgi:LytS/YehU family sensor histidine kinase